MTLASLFFALVGAGTTMLLSVKARPAWADEKLSYPKWLALLAVSSIVGTLIGGLSQYPVHSVMFGIFGSVGTVSTVTDLLYWKIPKGVQATGLLVSLNTLLINIILFFTKAEYSTLHMDIWGIGVGFSFALIMFGLALLSNAVRRSIGGGDLKMMLLLGLTSPIEVVLWGYMASLPMACVLYFAYHLAGRNKGDKKGKVAYGPPLSLATMGAAAIIATTGVV